MSIYYSLISGPDGSVLTVTGAVEASITSEAPTFSEAVQYLQSTSPDDLDPATVEALVDPRSSVQRYIKKISDRVSFRGSELLFDGDPVNSSLAQTIIRLSGEDESGDPTKLVKFLENLMTNPSEHSREQLYDWIAPRNITITSDGHFLAYKGLREDFSSIHAGPGIVNNVEYERENLDNTPGNVVEIARSLVVANSGVGCAVGLHAGTHEYASDFAQGKLVLVKINPRDVVSVPTDCAAQKLRVSRYEVLEEVQAKVENVLWTGSLTDWPDEDEDPDSYEDDDFYEDDEYDDEDDWDEDPDEDEDDDEDPLRYLRSFTS